MVLNTLCKCKSHGFRGFRAQKTFFRKIPYKWVKYIKYYQWDFFIALHAQYLLKNN